MMAAQQDSADREGASSASLPHALLPLARAGFALHWLREKSKVPIAAGWSTAPVADPDELRASYQATFNVGVRLGEPSRVANGFLHCLDIDIRLTEAEGETFEALGMLLPDVDFGTFPTVASGSGGASRHIYFVSDAPLRGRKLWTSGEKFRTDDGKWHYTAEIDLFGTGKQVAMPPSIHPDTGKPYTWECPFDLDLLDLGVAPFIPAARLAEITDPVDETFEFEAIEPLIFKPGQLEAELDELSLDRIDDRDDWLTLGMALHHQHGGSEEGFRLWMKASSRGSKYLVNSSERAERQRYRGFGRSRRRPVTMASVRQWILDARRQVFADAFEDLPDFDDCGFADPKATVEDQLERDKPCPLDGDVDPLDAPVELSWKSLLDFTENGAIRRTLHNLRLIVENDSRIAGVVAFNEFTQEVVQRGKPGKKPSREKAAKPTIQLSGSTWDLRDPVNGDFWTEDKDNAIRSLIEAPKTQGGYGFKVPDRDLRAAIDIVGRKNPFHPVREYLQGLEWDGVERVERLFIDYVGAPDDAYHRDVARIMAIAAVTRVHEPGAKFDSAVILEGLQGKRKSTFISILAKSWFVELDCDITDTRQVVETLQGAWIAEMNEMGGFTKADVRHAKAFISRRSDKVRLAYAKRAQEYHRQSILVGSTNDSLYLKDPTGARRFLPVRCAINGEIDTDRLLKEVDQIWAEALQLYREMRRDQPRGTLPLYLRSTALETAEVMQRTRTQETVEESWAGRIAAWLETPVKSGDLDFDEEQPVFREAICLMEIWEECLGSPGGVYNNSMAQTVGRAMALVDGWEERGQMSHTKYGKRQRAYRKVLTVN